MSQGGIDRMYGIVKNLIRLARYRRKVMSTPLPSDELLKDLGLGSRMKAVQKILMDLGHLGPFGGQS